MSFRDKLLDFKRRLSDRHMYSIVLVITALIATAGIYQYKKAMNYRSYVENQYNRAFHELVGYVDDLEVSLAKTMLINSPRQMEAMSSEIWRKAAFAQANLGQIPVSHIQLDNTSRFLSQIGDYTYSLSRKAVEGQPITDKEYTHLEQLHKYAVSLSKQLNEMQSDIYTGRMQFGELKQQGRKYFSKASKNIMTTKIENIEKEFMDYPSLIYDGPFSDHIRTINPRLLEGAKDITREQAQDIAVEFIGKERAQNVSYVGEDNGTIPTYRFTTQPAGQKQNNMSQSITINVTKKGGYVLWMLDNRSVIEAKLKINQAIEKANEFLVSRGIDSMTESYYLTNAGVTTINYAYVQEGIVMYPDLVKVKVALDNGDILGFESQGYIMAHQERRNLTPVKITEEAARSKVNSRLNIQSSRLAVIPLESKKEVLCYEFKGNFDNRDFLIYINVENGREEKILMLKTTPNGTLTI